MTVALTHPKDKGGALLITAGLLRRLAEDIEKGQVNVAKLTLHVPTFGLLRLECESEAPYATAVIRDAVIKENAK